MEMHETYLILLLFMDVMKVIISQHSLHFFSQH